MISLRGIHKSFDGNAVLKGIDLHVKKGETVALLGLSGSGKTTSLRLINGLEKPDSGIVSVFGKELSLHDLQDMRRQIGYVVQNSGLFPHYTVYDNVALVPRLLKWDAQRIEDRYAELMHKLHIDPKQYASSFPSQLSGGQRQRIGLARALAAYPPILLMDEPFGALDPITRVSIRREFKELDELKEKTIVLVTHDVREAFELADRIVIIKDGLIVQTGTPTEIINEPASDFVMDFIRDELLVLSLKEAELYDDLNKGLLDGSISSTQFKSLNPKGDV